MTEFGPKSILVIEDEEIIREMLQFALEMEGYKVYTAANGKEGFDLLYKIERPGLILLDLMMPIMDGREFMKALENEVSFSRPEIIPVVLITAFNTLENNKNIKSIIQKPMEMDLLLDTAKRYCQ